jgi:transcriptional regulator with XRE-family HTH domain
LIGQRIAGLRRDRNWTQLELARRTGLAASTIAAIEQDARRTKPEVDSLVAIARAFEITVDELLNGDPADPRAAVS